MKRGRIRTDGDFSGKGEKKEHDEYWTKKTIESYARYMKALGKYEKHLITFQTGYEDEYEEESQNLIRKFEKRRKKNLKLWNNCIRLSEYSGDCNINLRYMIKRR
jgi:cytochrome c peroxidase